MRACRAIAINAMIASVYAIATVINPLAFGWIQLRVSDVLSVIPFIIPCTAPGLIVGAFVANLFSPLGIIDSIFGVAVGSIAYYVMPRFVHGLYRRAIGYSIICGTMIGYEMYIILGIPFFVSAVSIGMSTTIVTVFGVFIARKLIRGASMLPVINGSDCTFCQYRWECHDICLRKRDDGESGESGKEAVAVSLQRACQDGERVLQAGGRMVRQSGEHDETADRSAESVKPTENG